MSGRDGSRLPVLVNIDAAAPTATRPLVYRATFLDATGRRAYERELLRQLYLRNPDCLFALHLRGTCL